MRITVARVLFVVAGAGLIGLAGCASAPTLFDMAALGGLSGSEYTGSEYTGSEYTGSEYTGSEYTGSQSTGSQSTGSDYTGSIGGTRGHPRNGDKPAPNSFIMPLGVGF